MKTDKQLGKPFRNKHTHTQKKKRDGMDINSKIWPLVTPTLQDKDTQSKMATYFNAFYTSSNKDGRVSTIMKEE